jgi:hypothetical protein
MRKVLDIHQSTDFFLGLREEGKERKGKRGMSAWGTVKEMGKLYS